MNSSLKIPQTLLQQIHEEKIFPSDLVLYVNTTCNLRCKHCYIGNSLLDQGISYSLPDVINFLKSFQYLDRLTILGGEPLLYSGFTTLLNTIDTYKIKELRVTTNLTSISKLQKLTSEIKNRLKVCVSLDGHNKQTHEEIRGENTFDRTVSNISKIIKDGFDVEITHTLMKSNLYKFDLFVKLCQKLGVTKINIHRMSLQGNALSNTFLQITPSEYVSFCNTLRSWQKVGGDISIRFPLLFTNAEIYTKMVASGKYNVHSVKSYYGSNHRIVIYSNRKIFISSEFFGTESHIGTFDDNKFYFNNDIKNEILFFEKDKTASVSDLNPNQSGDAKYPVVLSVSYKETITI